MTAQFDPDRRRQIKAALAREAYHKNEVRITSSSLAGVDWLVASNRGVFAVGPGCVSMVLRGWFFGIHCFGEYLYLFENCAMRDRSVPLGRIVRLRIRDRQLCEPDVLVTGLDASCHQLAVINDILCLADTANQTLRRYALDGRPIDSITPFPLAPPTDTSGGYLHINGLAKIGSRIAVMLHNGKADPARVSELAWLDEHWNLVDRYPLTGYCCHDIVADQQGVLWHSASMTGEIFSADGRRVRLSDRLMTRGIAFSADRMMVGLSSFGPRQIRDALPGNAVILDADLTIVEQIELPGSPTDIVAIRQ